MDSRGVFSLSQAPHQLQTQHAMICFVCRGRGEVEAGRISGSVIYGETFVGMDATGNSVPLRAQYPTAGTKNPNAMTKIHTGHKETDYYDIAYLDVNPLLLAWSTAICGTCHGAGQTRD
jgi:hypothetical protein